LAGDHFDRPAAILTGFDRSVPQGPLLAGR